VGDEIVSWNPFLKSLADLSEKLEELGLAYREGAAMYFARAGFGL
jgi:hypothetical protein